LSAVNGSVHVGRGATADEAKTVNGEIVVESDAKLGKVKTVNGSLEIGDGADVTGGATTVNGGIEIGKRVHVGGDVSTVSGGIELRGTEVGGRVITNNGDIELSDGAHVRGGILVEKNNSHNWGWGDEKPRPNKVRICSTCVVDGELRFDRPVELRVEQGAKIGAVIGDSVTRP
jgi:NDP-sugar pyrophosphorylase family protein